MWVTYLVFLGYTPYILNSKVVRESFCVTSNSKWFNILRVWRCRSFFYLSGSSWDRRTWGSGGFIFWNSRGPRMFERVGEDLIFSSIRILNYLFYLLYSLFYGWNWEEFRDPGKSTSFHMIFLGMMKLDLLIKFDWKRLVSPLGLVHKALNPTLVVILL